MRCSLKYYYAIQEKELEKRKKYYYKNREKLFNVEKNRRETHKNEIDELKKNSRINKKHGNVENFYITLLIIKVFVYLYL